MKFYEPTNRLVKSVLSQTFYIISGSVRFVKGFFEFSLLSDNFFSRQHRAIPMVRITTCRVEFFFRQYKNPQAVAELQARIFVKYEGKGASECANRELRGDASKKIPPRADSGKGSALGGIVTGSAISFSFGKVQVPRGQKQVKFRRRTNIHARVRRVTG